MIAIGRPSRELPLFRLPAAGHARRSIAGQTVARLSLTSDSRAFYTSRWRSKQNSNLLLPPLFTTTTAPVAPRQLKKTCVAASSPDTTAVEAARQTEAWQEALMSVQALGVDPDTADKAISHAFGWGRQKYWQREKIEETPDASRVLENVDYLKTVGFSEDDLQRLTEQFPEFLGCDLESRLRPNIEYLQTSFFLKGPHCVKAIMRKPNVLGNVIACEGDCKGQCTRCWSQF